MHVWSGLPTSGPPEFSITSDGDILPHLVMPPGTTGVNLQFLVDPGDPDQIWISDDGSQTVTIGVEIVEHHQPPDNQCLQAPSPQFNAFPCTDTDGLQVSNGNWIYVVDCGIFGCPPGWKRFSDLPSICRPSGDWVQRFTWTPSVCDQLGACCIEGDCSILDEASCEAAGGLWQDAGSTAAVPSTAARPLRAASPGPAAASSSIPAAVFLREASRGRWGPSVATSSASRRGVLPARRVVRRRSLPEECARCRASSGRRHRLRPGPTVPNRPRRLLLDRVLYLVLTEAEAAQAGAEWKPRDDLRGPRRERNRGCLRGGRTPGDLDGDGLVNGADLGLFLVGWGGPGVTDLNGDGVTNGEDLGILLVNWTG